MKRNADYQIQILLIQIYVVYMYITMTQLNPRCFKFPILDLWTREFINSFTNKVRLNVNLSYLYVNLEQVDQSYFLIIIYD